MQRCIRNIELVLSVYFHFKLAWTIGNIYAYHKITFWDSNSKVNWKRRNNQTTRNQNKKKFSTQWYQSLQRKMTTLMTQHQLFVQISLQCRSMKLQTSKTPKKQKITDSFYLQDKRVVTDCLPNPNQPSNTYEPLFHYLVNILNYLQRHNN